MGLPRAIKAHAANLLEEAEAHYRRAYEQGTANETLYQNFGALLRKVGKSDEAILLFEEGLVSYPKHAGIKRNYANLLCNVRPSYAIELYLDAISLSLSSASDVGMLASCCDDLIELLRRLNLLYWCQSLIQVSLAIRTQSSPALLKNLLLVLDEIGVSPESKRIVLSSINYEIAGASLVDSVSLNFALSEHYLHSLQHEKSLSHFEEALQRIDTAPHIEHEEGAALQTLVDTNSWNYACILLPLNRFDRGWSLYDHGLTTPADGQQKWQRALSTKPFSATDISLWRGQKDNSKRLLLLEEQGIGDSMMFISLLPALVGECKQLGLFISPRLESIYKRSFAEEILDQKMMVLTKHDLVNRQIHSSDFDFQIPLGSICQYRFTSIDSYAPRNPILLSDEAMADELRQHYLTHKSLAKRLVGVSWRGGGRGKRIQQKSLDVDLFGQLMLKHPDVRFVDLQYGETHDQIKAWQDLGIDIIHDPRINPLKDMNTWLAQVRSCDAVVSVANTTIHGAGGLNIPTQCLLSIHSDWRWLNDFSVTRSYWYPSVGIARESKDLKPSWTPALDLVSEWINEGCPMPCGPIV